MQKIITELKEQQKRAGFVNFDEMIRIVRSKGYSSNHNSIFFKAGVKHGLQMAIDLLEAEYKENIAIDGA